MGLKSFTEQHKIISFLTILITTILLTRIGVHVKNPNIMISGFELHHFYYGIIILIISNLLMLYRRSNFQTNLILSGIGIGLIIDEFMFIMGQIPNEQYFSTWPYVTIGIIITMLITEFIFYKFNFKTFKT